MTDDGKPQAQLAVQMRYSIPLFTYAAKSDSTAPMLDAHVVAGPSGRALAIHNGGTGHARLSDLRATIGGTDAPIKTGLVGYVLPGSTITIPLPPGALGGFRIGVNGTDQLLGPTA